MLSVFISSVMGGWGKFWFLIFAFQTYLTEQTCTLPSPVDGGRLDDQLDFWDVGTRGLSSLRSIAHFFICNANACNSFTNDSMCAYVCCFSFYPNHWPLDGWHEMTLSGGSCLSGTLFTNPIVFISNASGGYGGKVTIKSEKYRSALCCSCYTACYMPWRSHFTLFILIQN